HLVERNAPLEWHSDSDLTHEPTPLSAAVRHGHDRLVRDLVEVHGAQVDYKALTEACSASSPSSPSTFAYLLTHTTPAAHVPHAVRSSNIPLLTALLHHIPPPVPSPILSTWIDAACTQGDADALRLLLILGRCRDGGRGGEDAVVLSASEGRKAMRKSVEGGAWGCCRVLLDEVLDVQLQVQPTTPRTGLTSPVRRNTGGGGAVGTLGVVGLATPGLELSWEDVMGMGMEMRMEQGVISESRNDTDGYRSYCSLHHVFPWSLWESSDCLSQTPREPHV
ncbi:hypothetical protein HKX48_008759, partial [Thoreauomyces humboldtii]